VTKPNPQRDPSPLAGEDGKGPRCQARNRRRRKAVAHIALVVAVSFIAAWLFLSLAATIHRVAPPTPPADRP
jgi:type VI protein secretion system component VasF